MTTSTSTTYFVIYSNTSRNSTIGLRPKVMWTFDKDIVEAAACELNRSGVSLESIAGIEWIEDADGNITPARDLTDDEVLVLSIATLADDGRMYETFTTDDVGAAAFIKAADDLGIGDEARTIVEEFN